MAGNSDGFRTLVESLKLYVSLSIGIAVAFQAAARSAGMSTFWTWTPTALLVLCAIISIYQLNHHVYEPNELSTYGRNANIAAIICFGLGCLMASTAIYVNPPSPTGSGTHNGVSVTGNDVQAGPDVKTRVRVKRNASGVITDIEIN